MSIFYSQIDQLWERFPSRGDLVSISIKDNKVNGSIYGIQGDNIIVDLNGYGHFQTTNQNITYIERYANRANQNIPIEVNDLISIIANNDLIIGIISSIVSSHQVQVVVETNKLRFRAKGYLLNTTPTVKNEIQSQTMTAWTPEGTTVDAIIYKAPCVVKVVPYDVDPNQFEDLMEVRFSDDPETVVVLPVVRMKCGTILVVSSPRP